MSVAEELAIDIIAREYGASIVNQKIYESLTASAVSTTTITPKKNSAFIVTDIRLGSHTANVITLKINADSNEVFNDTITPALERESLRTAGVGTVSYNSFVVELTNTDSSSRTVDVYIRGFEINKNDVDNFMRDVVNSEVGASK